MARGLAVLCPFFTNSIESFPTVVKNTLLSFKDLNLYAALSDYFLVLVFLLWRPRIQQEINKLIRTCLTNWSLKGNKEYHTYRADMAPHFFIFLNRIKQGGYQCGQVAHGLLCPGANILDLRPWSQYFKSFIHSLIQPRFTEHPV